MPCPESHCGPCYGYPYAEQTLERELSYWWNKLLSGLGNFFTEVSQCLPV